MAGKSQRERTDERRGTLKWCSLCGGEFELDQFPLRLSSKRRPYREARCRSCRSKAIGLANRRREAVKLGLSIDEYDRAMERQRSRCGICRKTVPGLHAALDRNGDFQYLVCTDCRQLTKIALKDSRRFRAVIHRLEDVGEID